MTTTIPEPASWPARGCQPSAPALPPDHALVRVAVLYNGLWFHNASQYFGRIRGEMLLIEGLHDAIRWHAAGVFGCSVRHVVISHAHYVAGRDPDSASAGPDRVLADHGITRHDVPLTAANREIGADVEFALTAYEIACDACPDMIVLLASDGDFAPLAARLARRGTRVLVPVANFSFTAGNRTIAVTTSPFLARRATDAPALTDLLDAAALPGYPLHLRRPLAPGTASAGPAAQPAPDAGGVRLTGTVKHWDSGVPYGFIDSDHQLWFASSNDTPDRQALAPGTPVTFTGHPAAPAGKSHPRARAITPVPPASPPADPAAAPPPPAAGTTPGRTGQDPASLVADRLIPVDSATLTRLRTERGLAIDVLARQSALSTETVSRLELDTAPRCRQATVARLAATLGVPPPALTGTAVAPRSAGPVPAAAPASPPDQAGTSPEDTGPAGTSGRPPAYIRVDPAALTRLRAERGLGISALARKSGLSVGNLRRLEGDTAPRCYQNTMTRLATALGVPPAALTGTAIASGSTGPAPAATPASPCGTANTGPGASARPGDSSRTSPSTPQPPSRNPAQHDPGTPDAPRPLLSRSHQHPVTAR